MKAVKRCTTIFENAGGCDCFTFGLDHPFCKATTEQEVRALVPEECFILEGPISYYCELRIGKLVI